MAGTITEDEMLDKARELGTIEAAAKWMRQQGLTLAPNPIPPANRELPPVEPQGGLKTAERASTMAADTGEEDTTYDTEDTGAMGGLDLANLDFDQLQSNPGALLKSLFDASQAADKRAALSSKQLYDAGRQRIMEKYAGPTQSERLFALSKAMLSPTDFPGFKGFAANVTGALSENAKAAREAERKREEQLFALQQQYQQGEIERAAARPKTAFELAKLAANLNKPQWVRSVNPTTGEVTLTPVYPGQTDAGGAVKATFENTRYIDRAADMIKLPPTIKFFIAKDDPSQTPRPIPGR